MKHVFLFVMLGILIAIGACNTSDESVDGDMVGCTKDTDCKGDRVCVGGECVAPADGDADTEDGDLDDIYDIYDEQTDGEDQVADALVEENEDMESSESGDEAEVEEEIELQVDGDIDDVTEFDPEAPEEELTDNDLNDVDMIEIDEPDNDVDDDVIESEPEEEEEEILPTCEDACQKLSSCGAIMPDTLLMVEDCKTYCADNAIPVSTLSCIMNGTCEEVLSCGLNPPSTRGTCPLGNICYSWDQLPTGEHVPYSVCKTTEYYVPHDNPDFPLEEGDEPCPAGYNQSAGFANSYNRKKCVWNCDPLDQTSCPGRGSGQSNAGAKHCRPLDNNGNFGCLYESIVSADADAPDWPSEPDDPVCPAGYNRDVYGSVVIDGSIVKKCILNCIPAEGLECDPLYMIGGDLDRVYCCSAEGHWQPEGYVTRDSSELCGRNVCNSDHEIVSEVDEGMCFGCFTDGMLTGNGCKICDLEEGVNLTLMPEGTECRWMSMTGHCNDQGKCCSATGSCF